MNQRDFEKILDARIEACRSVLAGKATEYADDNDRLHNFHQAAVLMGGNSAQALAGMMVKHTVSVYDMVQSGQSYPLAVWEEKIGDELNYLFLLRAAIVDDKLITY